MLRVRSEIGRLRKVLVHEPGPEVDRMVPAMLEELLFDDILFGDRARDEHRQFRRVLQLLGVEALDAEDLLGATLEIPEARAWVMDVVLEDLAAPFKEPLGAAEDLAAVLVGGSVAVPAPGRVDTEDLYDLAPLPNWCFQRDPQVVLGDGVVFGSMAAEARHREALLSRVIFRFHPDFQRTPVLLDPIEIMAGHPHYSGPTRPCLEGGDVLVLSPDVIAVGHSERTNRAGILALARALARRDGAPRWMVVVELLRRRAFMHLDTVVTPVDHDACLLFPPVLLPGTGGVEARVHELDLHAAQPTFAPRGDFLAALRAHGIDFEPIPCGGSDPVTQQREQWTDGANALALAPGIITLYDRNLGTADELARCGFRVVDAEALLLGRDEVDLDDDGRVCILVPSHEISRARGGPHCLTHPLVRDADREVER
jgi:arginine deiminase